MADHRTDQDSADQKAHGTHGRGKGNEQRVDDANVDSDPVLTPSHSGGC
jgi:hypothetical protein